ncbi:hypothetical protein ARMSODRAFT_936258 [Armillaria solidipes]|uniref:Reverse transcriptase domain-containing protein n=1 Tax=Armillaria solidipes TaxID=1076256 RepID=A0A2H3BH77_9AGAR|nr:hypothetical protein ARMSODRAFT_936258 [Armillaria solidipes]
MYKKGVAGPLFDWLRMLYDGMSYVVRMGSAFSASFRSTVGILAGDSGSPGFWNFFASDLVFVPHPEDISIGGRRVMNIEQADDGAMFSGPLGLQAHLDVYGPWSSRKGLLVNIPKTKAMAFGKLPSTLPVFTILGRPIEWTNEHKYLGVTFTSSRADIFSQHYTEKEKSARRTANVTFTLQKYFGDLPPREGVLIYKSRIDPHLTFGAEVAVDVASSGPHLLENVQVAYLRRLLSVQKRSMRVIVFTETGILPLPYRRIMFALRYLRRILHLGEQRIPVWCLEANVDLWLMGKPCWLGDIVIVLRRLGFSETELSLESLLNPEHVDMLINAVPEKGREWVLTQVSASSRLQLMDDRWERLTSGQRSSDPLIFRSYLLTRIRDHRIALTRLLTASHGLGVERGRWVKIRNSSIHVPRAFRLCRLCRDDVEDEMHVLFVCTDGELDQLRVAFLAEVWKRFPALRHASSTPISLFHTLLSYPDLVPRLARFVFDACQVVEKTPMYLHPGTT